jgi:hypothetical protein
MGLMPTLRWRPFPDPFIGARIQVPFAAPVFVPSPPEAEEYDERCGVKERNRLAAQKWRQKKDRFLVELERANDSLRKQALDLTSQAHSLRLENKLLEEELTFFQHLMSRLMGTPN